MRSQPCRWCERIVHGTDRRSSQCPVLFQLQLAQLQRQAVSASPQTECTVQQTWPMTCPHIDIAACAGGNHDILREVELVARTKCLLCGELMQDIQAWRRHVKQRHEPQHVFSKKITDLTPCRWPALLDHARGAEFISRNRPGSIERSACPCCNFACSMTPAPTPMEATPEQQLATVWGLSSPLAPTAPTQGQTSRQRAPTAQQRKFRKGMAQEKRPSCQSERESRKRRRSSGWTQITWTRRPLDAPCER